MAFIFNPIHLQNIFIHRCSCSVPQVCPTFCDPHGLQHTRLPCPSPSPGACSNSCPLSWWCHPTILYSVIPFSSCPQSFAASESFPMSQFFTSGGQSIGTSTSASALPINIQGWFPLGLNGLISLMSKETLHEPLQHHSPRASVLQALGLLYGPTVTSVYDSWRNHNFEYMDLCQQSDVFAF